MTDDLRNGLRAVADGEDGADARPDVAHVWRAGRRRRTARRALGAAAAVVVVLAIGAAAVAVTDDDGQTVRTTEGPTRIDAGSCRPAPTEADMAPPATVDEFVHGRPADGSDGAPTMVVRGVVERTYWYGPADLLSDEVGWWRIVALLVTDPVTGAETGDYLDVLVADPVAAERATPGSDEVLGQERGKVQQQIDELQNEVDEIDRPLAELDAQIMEVTPPTTADGRPGPGPADPRYQELIDLREGVRARTEAARIEAQDRLSALQQELQRLDNADRQSLSPVTPAVNGPPCHQLRAGDDVIMALTPTERGPLLRLASPSSYFVIDDDGRVSPSLDTARRSVPGWSDSDLLDLARESTSEEFIDQLRQAAAD